MQNEKNRVQITGPEDPPVGLRKMRPGFPRQKTAGADGPSQRP